LVNDTKRAVVEHHLDPVNAISNYDQSNAVLPSHPDLDALDFIVMDDPARVANIASYSELGVTDLDDDEVDDLIDFLNALTDPASIDIRNDLPRSVPSGLPMVD